MAAAKRKRTQTKRKTAKKKTNRNKTQSNLSRVCLLLCLIAVCIMAVFRLGMVGTFFYQLFNLFVGTLAVPMMIVGILICFMVFFDVSVDSKWIRYVWGGVLIILSLDLLLAVQEFPQEPYWYGFAHTAENAMNILMDGRSSASGLIGCLLLGIFGSMFSTVGCYVIAVLFVGIAVVLIGYDSLADMVQNRAEKTKEKPVRTRKKKKADSDLFIEADDPEPVRKPKRTKKTDIPEPIEASVEPEPEPIEIPAAESDFHSEEYKDYQLPGLDLLEDLSRKSRSNANANAAKEQGRKLIEILDEFGVKAELVQIHIGPSVTKFEIKPELGVRVSRISNLQYDIKMGLAATDIRIEAPIPGKSAVGIEIPNVEKTTVQMKDLMRSIPPKYAHQPLLFCLGKDLMGENVYGRLDKMPHLLIAGATGSGKSVCVNSIICSLLMRTRPDEVKMVLIDPKKVEFTPYKGIPHLIAPVITDGDMANKALKVVVKMMDHRYDVFEELGVRNITAYNAYVSEHPDDHFKPLPRIIVIIDELADLMLVAAKDVESSIQRITQLARAAGIHLIVATQRPSVDVITGVVKANIPSRIAFAVSQAVDSRTILDQSGAERLLGNGDMLYLPNGETNPQRIQGVFIKDGEVNAIASYVKKQAKPQYDDAFVKLREIASQGGQVDPASVDPIYEDVKHFVIQGRRASTSLIQRKFSVGYSRAARLMDFLEEEGIIGPANGSKPREILVHNTLEDESD
ncbi:DNA translocase FtsK [Catenisphaera adipataccumulans]|jgi:S-DNA-T family DNA segregation ATPase FtsK/SpoIIIE|uniref:S-DNA-T family DNA segregation ATPase FtsK/SpoIIIE n=1 Tax=Catenisphaera adipataccumulans TaxID=700500 RepID=A0A7W8D0K8_9FIRM|nr:DNA translocase FtsK [Catenisphaera adipataccumulans]MBB5183888.1 S-DNA-T family DNA segregation ATPase FtsK/SpoIIIE [Catenisphaera adipataccumulans]